MVFDIGLWSCHPCEHSGHNPDVRHPRLVQSSGVDVATPCNGWCPAGTLARKVETSRLRLNVLPCFTQRDPC